MISQPTLADSFLQNKPTIKEPMFLRYIETLLQSVPASIPSALIIDRQAVVDNYAFLSKLGSPARCGASIKADAYGLGAQTLAPLLYEAGCRDFFVAYLQEGIALREVLPQDPNLSIFILNGLFPKTASEFVERGVVPVLSDLAHLEAWRQEAVVRMKKLPAVLHVDTGMCRTGFSSQEAYALLERSEFLQDFDIRLIMSHLACSDSSNHFYNRQQLQRFQAYLEKALIHLPKVPASFANSGGIFLGKPYHFQLLRPGMAIYGLNPTPGGVNPLKPVAHAWARIFQVQGQSKGHSIGYSQAFIADKTMRIATVALGYADGIPWDLANKHFFSIYGFEGGKTRTFRAPIVGRVSMDLVTLDVTDIPEDLVQPGKWVEAIGVGSSADDIAGKAQHIGYEVLLSLGSRIHRVYTDYTVKETPTSCIL